jgi:hypothetical protein
MRRGTSGQVDALWCPVRMWGRAFLHRPLAGKREWVHPERVGASALFEIRMGQHKASTRQPVGNLNLRSQVPQGRNMGSKPANPFF